MRSVAALAIVFFHLKNIAMLPLPDSIAPIVDHFYLSVHLFFVLSAYSLYHSHVCSPVSVTCYLRKRFFRIAPLFYALILFNIYRSGFPGWKSLTSNVLFVFNLFPNFVQSINWAGWSVGVEMLFYILLPVLLYLATRCQEQWRGFLALLVVSSLLSAYVWHLSAAPDYYAYFSILANLAPFCAGLLAYAIYQRVKNAGGGIAIPFQKWFLVLIFITSLLSAFLDPLGFHASIPGFYFSFWSIPFATLCLWQSLYPSRLLKHDAAQWLADRSFSIYLLHPIVIEYGKPVYAFMARHWEFAGTSLYAASMCITLSILLILANLTFRFVEMPGIEIGRRLTLGPNIRIRDLNEKPCRETGQ